MEWAEIALKISLFDPKSPPPDIEFDEQNPEWAYIRFLANGVTDYIANVETDWLALQAGDNIFPVTVNNNERGGSYVCLPHSAYILYGRQELDIVDVGFWKAPMRCAIAVADHLLMSAGINKIVQLDNWLLSTNLHGDWSGEGLANIRDYLTKKFPDHILAIRSVDRWSCPELVKATTNDGWVSVPSRQIWVIGDMENVWRRKNSSQNDRRLFAKTPLVVEDIEELRPGDAERISQLYFMLYVGKYSPLNPVFTPGYITQTFASGIFRYRGARDASGRLMAVAGSFVRGGILTPPVVGYDTSRPQSEGLYRIACYLFSDYARKENLRLNGSAGAAAFKKHRGATNVIEYTMMYIEHLSVRRRLTIRMLAWLLKRFVVPVMKRKEL